MSFPTTLAGEFMLKRGGSVNPSKFPDETFDLLSIPAFDKQSIEVLRGDEIGSSKSLLQPRDVLLSKIIPHIRRCWVVPENVGRRQIGSGEWIIFRGEDFYSEYLKHFLTSNIFHQQFMNTVAGVGGSLVRARPAQVELIEVPLPPLTEQKKIAQILDVADSLRKKDLELIEHYKTLNKSLFIEMFGDPVTNPMGWEKSKADSYIDLLTGFAFKSKDYSKNTDDIHLCGGLIITPTGIDWSKANYWSRDNLDGLERYKLLEDDIVMAMDRPWISTGFKIHKFTSTDKDSFLVQRTARIRGKNINQDFLYSLYKHSAFEMQAHTTETTVPHISPKDIRKYELIIPPLKLQDKFAKKIQIIEQQKQQAELNLVKSEELFNNLLQLAFKGELTS